MNSGETGVIQFGETTDLRLLDRDGDVVHSRRFLRDDVYDSVHNKVLRKADGTAFFVFPSAGPDESFSQGSYRVQLNFVKDHTAFDPSSLVLSEAGQATQESAILDIPWSAI